MQQASRIMLNINGVERAIICDPENDTLAVALRRSGLTGTKVGCNIGACGACSVLLNGKVIRSCTRKMKSVPEFSEILTIEGIGTPQHLHPLQQAWITYGGVQCGFCTPGFIISAFGLLMENAAPSREDVRDWFTKHRNICRCTGYKPLVDSVMAAAKVMRGEADISGIIYSDESDIYGSKRPRPAALSKVTGLCDYGDDIALKMPAGTAHLALVISEAAHANIIDIDTGEAEKIPGVIKVLLGKDIKGTNKMGLPSNHKRARGSGPTAIPVIADTKINKRGDVVAVVAADTREHALQAALKVRQKLEILPSYMNLLDSVAPDAIQIHPNMPNFHGEQPVFKGEDTREIMESAAYIVEGSFYSQREPHLPIEPDVIQAYPGSDGLLTIQCKSQSVYIAKMSMAPAIGVPEDKIRVIINPTGGSFGYSVFQGAYAIAAAAALDLQRPVTLTMPYKVHQHFTGKRAVTYSNGRLACDSDGKIIAAEWDIGIDHGAYMTITDNLMNSCTRLAFHGYNIPNVMALARQVVTNHNHAVPYRGFGSPQIYTCSEALMDMMADKIGMDPFEFRYINLAKPGDLNINSYPYKEYPMIQIMDTARPYYDDFKTSSQKNSASDKKRGVGIGFGGFNVCTGAFDTAQVALQLNHDGTITHFNTWEDMGQGGDIGTLTLTVKALEQMGIKPEQVKLVMGDTKTCPNTGIAAASRSHYMAGFATIDAANKLMDAMRKPDGSYRTYEEMVAEGIPTYYLGSHDLKGENLSEPDPNTGVGDRTPTYMYCINIAEVEVDMSTGKTTVLRFVAVSDTGVVGNRLAVDGQAYGGLSHCIGFALSEQYDDVDKHDNILSCGIPACADIPDDITVIHLENPRANGPFGSSGCSENFQASGHMAIINAIYNATGVRIYDLPATAAKVKAALDSKTRNEETKPVMYFLGSDFYEEMDEIRNNPV